MTQLPDLNHLSHAEKDVLIRALWAQVQALTARVAELEARLGGPPKNSDNSSQPPSRDQKANREDKPKRQGPRQGSLGRKGGGRALTANPDETVIARPICCAQCRAAFAAADRRLVDRFDKIELPAVTPVVTRVELYAGDCQACGATTLAPLPQGLEQGSPFSINIVALALYLRFTHAISYQRLSRLLLELFGLAISEGALDAAFRRAKPCFDAEVGAILARLRRARVVCSDETSVRVDGRTCWNWVFQNSEVVIHVIRHSRGAGVVGEVMAGHRPAIWVSDLYGAQQGHAEHWQICLAHQLRDCQFAIEAGDSIFAPRVKALLLRAFVRARRRHHLATARAATIASSWNATSMRSWRWRRQPKTAGDCESDTASSAPTCSPSSTIPRSAPTTTAANGNSAPPQPTAKSPAASVPTGGLTSSPASAPSSEPPPVEASAPIRPSK